MDIFLRLSAILINWANQLILVLSDVPAYSLFVTSLFLLNFALVAKKLKSFNKPDWPLISPVVRESAVWLHMLSLLLIIAFGLYLLTIFVMVELGFILAKHQTGLKLSTILLDGVAQLWMAASQICKPIIAGSICALGSSAYINFMLIPAKERGEGLTDVRELVRKLRQLDAFAPQQYMDITKGCFVGKDSLGKPIYIPWQKLRETHMQIMGTTGSGKGVVMSLIVTQCILAKEGMIWFDPKFDRYSPLLMKVVAKKAGKEFHFINLNLDQPAQFNLLAGCSNFDIEELFVAGFGLRSQGSDADFYRGRDEDAAILASQIAVSGDIKSINDLYTACSEVTEITEQENFWRLFTKLQSIPAISTARGLDLEAAILNGDVIYIVGSCDNERVIMLQKMILVRMMQVIKKRDRASTNTPIAVVLDEFKYLLSSTALNALGVVRDFDSHFLLAHQSLGDLADCGGINPVSAYGAVVDNTALKILYKISDAEHAEKMAKLAGMKRTYVDQTSKLDKSEQGPTGGWREAQTYLIPVDLITHLPMPKDRENQASTGILFGLGNARMFHVGPLKVKTNMPRVSAAEVRINPISIVQDAQELI